MSEVRTNSILRPADDKLLLRKEGCVLQTITEASYSSVYTNTTGNSEYDLPGDLGNGNAQITPIFSDSRLLFTAVIHCGHNQTWRQNYFKTYYKIGSGNWTLFNGGFGCNLYNEGTHAMGQTATVSYLLSSLSTTSTVSFKITHIGHANGGYLHLNKNKFSNSDSADNDIGVASQIILQEIGQ